jgi:hypothetical protein
MNLLRLLHFLSGLALVSSIASCSPSIEPAFSTEQTYGRDLLSREECDKINFMSEFTCRESARFRTDGSVTLLLGGSDGLFSGTYQRKGKKITISTGSPSPRPLSFEVIEDNTLKRIETGDVWVKQ